MLSKEVIYRISKGCLHPLLINRARRNLSLVRLIRVLTLIGRGLAIAVVGSNTLSGQEEGSILCFLNRSRNLTRGLSSNLRGMTSVITRVNKYRYLTK